MPDMAPADPVPSKAANKPGSFEFDVEFPGLDEPECCLELLVRTSKLKDSRQATGTAGGIGAPRAGSCC